MGLAGTEHRAPGTAAVHAVARPVTRDAPDRTTARVATPSAVARRAMPAPVSGGAPTTSPTGPTGYPATTTRAPFNRIAAIEPADRSTTVAIAPRVRAIHQDMVVPPYATFAARATPACRRAPAVRGSTTVPGSVIGRFRRVRLARGTNHRPP